jgi:hypothetical protein
MYLTLVTFLKVMYLKALKWFLLALYSLHIGFPLGYTAYFLSYQERIAAEACRYRGTNQGLTCQGKCVFMQKMKAAQDTPVPDKSVLLELLADYLQLPQLFQQTEVQLSPPTESNHSLAFRFVDEMGLAHLLPIFHPPLRSYFLST